jgi:hypothetical protein
MNLQLNNNNSNNNNNLLVDYYDHVRFCDHTDKKY